MILILLVWPAGAQLPLSPSGKSNLKLPTAHSENQGKPLVEEEKSQVI